jgi:hypothetical protein
VPYGRRGSFWPLFGRDVTLRRTEYDANLAAEMFRTVAPDYPGLAEFIDENCADGALRRRSAGRFSQWPRRSDEASRAE